MAQGFRSALGLTAGQAHDGQIANELLSHLGPHTIVLADKAYDADRIRRIDRGAGRHAPISPQNPIVSGKARASASGLYSASANLIERFFFSRLKAFPAAFATRYDKLADNFLAMIQLASMRLWLRAYESTT